ncbi:hypothetical protein [Streptomonospora wellingtoniae]|uniref:Uncharacterized protein n=1 Tax=Streptomonospora wellingtoniae TaxID=3075544 RepID=A0ABU2KSD6_9ACTN|nr:hypothetical protein [Streptomonospora sp. DSM 45055]MDT0302184.1 hypothetical protein [Streptomonospora sp. DSM 45055]
MTARVLFTVLVCTVLAVGVGPLPPPPAGGAVEEVGMHELAGFTVGHLPEGVGGQVSDFHTEWGGVAFSSRVWERELPDGGYTVDLKVNVLRGERLGDLAAVRDFLSEYHERDMADGALRPFRHGEAAGHRIDGLVFWLVEPGLVVEVRLDPAHFGESALTATALGVHRVEQTERSG